VIISLSPTEAEMREDAALMAHLSGRRAPAPSVGAHRQPEEPGHRGQDHDRDAGRWFRSQSLSRQRYPDGVIQPGIISLQGCLT
jgi:hypothetical protein